MLRSRQDQPMRDIREAVAELDIQTVLSDGDYIEDAMIVCTIARVDSRARPVCVALTEHTSPVVMLGLIEAARQINDRQGWEPYDDTADD